MTRSEINQIITDYARYNLSPTKKERNMISEKYEELGEVLNHRTFPNGSYARHTSTTPVNDLDVIYRLPEDVVRDVIEAVIEPQELDISNILETLAAALRKEYPNNVNIKVQPHSVGIYFGEEDEFSIDVVPAIETNNGLLLVPESSHLSIRKRRQFYESSPAINWIKSDPKGYIQDASLIDKRSNGDFRKSAKFGKKWKQGCKEKDSNFPLKSFHIEIAITELFKRTTSSNVLTAISGLIEQLDQLIIQPQFPDRADPKRFIDEYVRDLSEIEKSKVLNAQSEAIEILNALESAQVEPEVINLIERFLGVEDHLKPVSILLGTTARTSSAYSKPFSKY